MTQKPALTPKANCKKMNTRELAAGQTEHAGGQDVNADLGGVDVDTGHLGGGQRLTNDGRVADGVHLLQKVGQDHRQRKQEDHLPARPLGQVDGLPSFMCCFHRNRSLLLCSIDNYLSQSADYNTLRRHCQELFYKKSVHRSFPVPRCRSSRILRRISAFRQWTQPVFRCTFCHFVVRYH